MIETSSGEVDNCMAEIDKMRELKIASFGVNVPLLLLRDPSMIERLLERKPRFITTSAGSPTRLTPILKEAGATVYHSVATTAMAHKAVAAGVDGLVLEGHEGGGFKNIAGVSTLVLVRTVRAQYPQIPIIAAGGIADGNGMAAAIIAGADGVQMGTRFVASRESPVHANYKNAIVQSSSDDTIVVNRNGRPMMRVLNTESAQSIGDGPIADTTLADIQQLYFKGDMDASVALAGQSAAMIQNLPSVENIITDTLKQARAALAQGVQYGECFLDAHT